MQQYGKFTDRSLAVHEGIRSSIKCLPPGVPLVHYKIYNNSQSFFLSNSYKYEQTMLSVKMVIIYYAFSGKGIGGKIGKRTVNHLH